MLFERIRLGRASTVQLMSAVRQDHGPERAIEVLRECEKYFEVGKAPGKCVKVLRVGSDESQWTRNNSQNGFRRVTSSLTADRL